MSFAVQLPVHQQDDFEETLDTVITEQDATQTVGGTPLSDDDLRLRDYLVRKAKEIMADAPIVATHLVAEISGHANAGGSVAVPGMSPSPGFTISVSVPASLPAAPPVAQQPQTAPVLGTADELAALQADEAAESDVVPAPLPTTAPADPSAAPVDATTPPSGAEAAATPSEPAPAPTAPEPPPAA